MVTVIVSDVKREHCGCHPQQNFLTMRSNPDSVSLELELAKEFHTSRGPIREHSDNWKMKGLLCMNKKRRLFRERTFFSGFL